MPTIICYSSSLIFVFEDASCFSFFLFFSVYKSGFNLFCHFYQPFRLHWYVFMYLTTQQGFLYSINKFPNSQQVSFTPPFLLVIHIRGYIATDKRDVQINTVFDLIMAHTLISAVKQFRSLQITASVFCLLHKGVCCGYPFELHQLVDAIQMSTHNICFYKGNKNKTEKTSHKYHLISPLHFF